MIQDFLIHLLSVDKHISRQVVAEAFVLCRQEVLVEHQEVGVLDNVVSFHNMVFQC